MGSRIKDQGSRIKDQGSRIKDQKSRIKDQLKIYQIKYQKRDIQINCKCRYVIPYLTSGAISKLEGLEASVGGNKSKISGTHIGELDLVLSFT